MVAKIKLIPYLLKINEIDNFDTEISDNEKIIMLSLGQSLFLQLEHKYLLNIGNTSTKL
jgi:hypothetical protein